MLQVNDRVDSQPTNPDGKVTAEYLNKGSVKEVQNIVTQTSQTFDSADLTQLGQGICAYASHGDFYTASGTADVIVASVNASKVSPPSYADGMRVRFVAAGTNTGVATIDVNSLGAKDIRLGGSALAGGEIQAGKLINLWYDAANSRFELDISGSGAWTLVQEVATSGTNSYTVLGIPSTATMVRIDFSNIDFGSADRPVIRTANAGTPQTTNYNNSILYWTGAATARAASTIDIEPVRDDNIPSTDTISGCVFISRSGTSQNWNFVGRGTTDNLTGWSNTVGITPALTNFNGIQFLSRGSNNFSGGSFAVYYQ